jgi:hypothetical protein
LRFEVHAAADFLNELDIAKSASGTEGFERLPLVL